MHMYLIQEKINGTIMKSGRQKMYSQTKYYFQQNEKLNTSPPNVENSFSEYISDPFNPVPYTATFQDSKNFYNRVHLIEDQRFASTRPDVLTFETDQLSENVTIAGPITADLFVSTTGTDADFVVKLIDVYPDDEKNPDPNPEKVEMGGYERLVRTEIISWKISETVMKNLNRLFQIKLQRLKLI